jgi:5-methylcytosine-specific restriction endonuclease McrA
MKCCSKCKKSKPLNAYHKDGSKKGGLRSCCKECQQAYSARYYPENADKIRARVAAWNAANPDKVKTGSARYYAENADKVRAKAAAWRADNPEKKRENNAAWNKANPFHVRAKLCFRKIGLKVKDHKEQFIALIEYIQSILVRQCALCDYPIAFNVPQWQAEPIRLASLDHILPISTHPELALEHNNLQWLCHICNSSKQDRTPEEYAAYLSEQSRNAKRWLERRLSTLS